MLAGRITIALLSLVLLTGFGGPPPADAVLIDRFRAHHDVIEQLHQQLCAMAPQTVWTDSNDSSPRLAPEKRAPILALMNQLEATRVAAIRAMTLRDGRSLPCGIDIMLWATGALSNSDSRGYLYMPLPDAEDLEVPDVSNVDVPATVHHFPERPAHGHRRYLRRIEGDWWLVRNYWE